MIDGGDCWYLLVVSDGGGISIGFGGGGCDCCDLKDPLGLAIFCTIHVVEMIANSLRMKGMQTQKDACRPRRSTIHKCIYIFHVEGKLRWADGAPTGMDIGCRLLQFAPHLCLTFYGLFLEYSSYRSDSDPSDAPTMEPSPPPTKTFLCRSGHTIPTQ